MEQYFQEGRIKDAEKISSPIGGTRLSDRGGRRVLMMAVYSGSDGEGVECVFPLL